MVEPITTKYEAVGFIDSRIGGRKENQDCAGARDTELGLLVVVCDGMGGMQGGQIASSVAVTSIMQSFSKVDIQSDPSMTLVKSIIDANANILAKASEDPNLHGMGTTVTALLITPKSAIIAHVGDSRVYQLRGTQKAFRTFDHSMVFQMVKKKIITEEQARLSAQSNVILRALGVKPDVEVEVHEVPYLKGDRFILCSDGFWGAMPELDFLQRVTDKTLPIEQILENTANEVEKIGQEKGGEYDNLTAAIIDVKSNSKMKVKMNKSAKIIIGVLALFLVASFTFNGYFVCKNYCSDNDKAKTDSIQVNDSINGGSTQPTEKQSSN